MAGLSCRGARVRVPSAPPFYWVFDSVNKTTSLELVFYSSPSLALTLSGQRCALFKIAPGNFVLLKSGRLSDGRSSAGCSLLKHGRPVTPRVERCAGSCPGSEAILCLMYPSVLIQVYAISAVFQNTVFLHFWIQPDPFVSKLCQFFKQAVALAVCFFAGKGKVKLTVCHCYE